MQSKNKNVLFVTEEGDNARAYYRGKLPVSGLTKLGFQARQTNVLYEQENHKWNGWAPGDNSVYPAPKFIVLHTILTPEKGSKPGEPLKLEWQSQQSVVESIREHGQYCFFDLDDDIFNIPPWNPQYDSDSGIPAHLDMWRDDINSSNGLFVSTPSIRESCITNGITVSIFLAPNSIDYYNYEPHLEHSPLRVAWLGSLAFREEDFKVAIPTLYEAFNGRRFDVEFWHIGADFQYSIRNLLPKFPVDIVERPWYRVEYLSKAIQEIDIAIIPAVDHRFNYGRSNILGLACRAGGVPVLASNIGEYQEYVDIKYLSELLDDRLFRLGFQDSGRYYVTTHGPKDHAKYYEKAFESCLIMEQ